MSHYVAFHLGLTVCLTTIRIQESLMCIKRVKYRVSLRYNHRKHKYHISQSDRYPKANDSDSQIGFIWPK